MEIHIKLLNELNRKDLIPDFHKHRADTYAVNVHNIESALSKKELETLKTLAAKEYKKARTDKTAPDRLPGIATTYQKLIDLVKLLQSDTSLVVSSLATLETALKQYVETSPMKWMFLELQDKTLVPYFVNGIKYVVSYSRDEVSKVVMHLMYEGAEGTIKGRSFSFYKEDLKGIFEEGEKEDGEEGEERKEKKIKGKGVKISTLCKHKNLHLGTEELYNRYKEQVELFTQLKGTTGKILVAKPNSIGCYVSTLNWREESTFDRYKNTGNEDSRSMLITDDNEEETIKSGYFYSWYKEMNSKYESSLGSKFWGADFIPAIPIHPRVKCFDFAMRSHCMMHVDYIEVKTFASNLREKLVLPEKDKTFIDMLMESSKIKVSDIVAGKAGGVTILSTGTPGTGKTLTAEIYAEEVKKPLYSVQCSELGVDPEKLEKSLNKVLRRAERWKAILLLDEADVYIRERGEDIQHNAIVGVFLRVLEYYSGILFMTTNKLEGNIDDAIISRCTAHLRYKNFTGDLLAKGWEVLSKQFEVDLSKKDIKHLCEKWTSVSGRSIKNLLKLTRKYASAKGEKPSAAMVEIVSEYSPAFKTNN